MPTVVLARHGRTNANATGVLAGRTPGVVLDGLGKEQVAGAADRLRDVPVVAVVSSPMERCRQTATMIAKSRETPLKVNIDRHFAEVDYGAWTGRDLKDLAKEPLWKTVQAHPAAASFPDGESLAQMSARVVAGIRRWNQRIADEHGPDAVWVLSSHGDPIKAILADALGMHLDAFQRIVVDPASLSVVRYTELRPFVVTTNTRAGALPELAPPPSSRRGERGGRSRRRGSRMSDSDAVVGGGAGGTSVGSSA